MAEGTIVERLPASIRAVPWSVLSIVAMAIALVALVSTYDPPADAAEEIGSLIRCPVCQGVPIADSPSPMARDMMAILRQSLDEGATRQEAIEAVLGAYPGSLLLEPEVNASTLALWLIPVVALVGGGGLVLTLRRGRRASDVVPERREIEDRLAAVRADLDELALQEAAGDIDQEAAHHLRAAYQTEFTEAQTALAELQPVAEPLARSPRRVAIGAAVIVVALAAIVVAAGAFLVDRPDTTSGVAGALEGDPSDYSNETLAAVIAANQDHPQIDGMRLALAERHFAEGDYQSAFPYSLDVASSDLAARPQVATALTRLGWMADDGNGEVDTALDLLAQARTVAPEDPFPLYLEGIVTWCGNDDAAAAAAAFREVLASGVEDAEVRRQVEGDLAATEAGEACPR